MHTFQVSKLNGMSIDQMFAFAKDNPCLFEIEAELFQMENIKKRCGDDEQCLWRYNGFLRRLNKEASAYKDKTARLNFVIARLYKFISENY